MPVKLLADTPARPDLFAGAARMTSPDPSFTRPAEPVSVLAIESVEPASA